MCGIGGILGDARGVDGAAMAAALAHRGPDQQGAAAPAEGIWLCAARLAIRDLSPAGAQPMMSEDGALTVVYNGELYHAGALRTRLEKRGARVRSRCDTELLLHAYRRWGDALTDEIDGMFAFALWDAPKRRLLIARDRIGVKPLWVARSPGRVAFASEVRALLAAGALERSLSPAGVAGFLAAGSAMEAEPLVRGLEALPPGCRASFEHDGRAEKKRYWSFPERPPEGDAPDAKQAAERVRAHLAAAVDGCLESDVPVAILLSGGIDSAALALLARGRPVSTFHVRQGDGAAAGRARDLAASLGLEHREIDLAPAPPLALEALAAQDLPSVDGVNTFLIAKAIREAGIKVALSGLGADELFHGYPLHRDYVLARELEKLAGPAAAPLQRAAQRVAGPVARALASLGGLHGLTGWSAEKLLDLAGASGAAQLYGGLRALFPASSLAHLCPGIAVPLRPDQGGASFGAEIARMDVSGYLLDTLLRDADVMSMAHGVELRVPMLERPLVEELLRLPDSLLLRDEPRVKPLLCDAVPELPAAITSARKEGFDLPLDDWLAEPLRAPVEELLLTAAATDRAGLEPVAAAKVWVRFADTADRPSAHRAWALYALTSWAERNRMST